MGNLKSVFALTQNNGRTYKTRIGVAYPKDGSIIVRLNALPVSGVLEICDREEPPKRHFDDSGDD